MPPLDVVVRSFADQLDVAVLDLADHLAGRAEHQRVVGNFFVFRDQAVGADDAVLADLRAGQDDGADGDQCVVADDAAVQHAHVADAHIVAERAGVAGIGMQHAAVLHLGVLADRDQLVVAADHAVPPDAGVLLQDHLADGDRVGGDPGFLVRLNAVFAEGIVHLLVSCCSAPAISGVCRNGDRSVSWSHIGRPHPGFDQG